MISRSTTPRRLPPDADGRRNDRRYDARLGVAVGAAKVEEVLVEEPEHVLGEVARRDGDRRQARRLSKLLYEPGAVGHALDPQVEQCWAAVIESC